MLRLQPLVKESKNDTIVREDREIQVRTDFLFNLFVHLLMIDNVFTIKSVMFFFQLFSSKGRNSLEKKQYYRLQSPADRE
jgi:hypothetical protein